MSTLQRPYRQDELLGYSFLESYTSFLPVSLRAEHPGVMNRTPGTRDRRKFIMDIATGLPEHVQVVLYACIHDDRDPEVQMAALRKYAEARDWVVHTALHDQRDITSTRTDRRAWPLVERLLESREVTGLVAPSEDEIAAYPLDKQRLRKWLLGLPAFAVYTACPVRGVAGGFEEGGSVR
ncbi:hypothetical protein ACQEVX_29865 [Streptomyces syringium]|uniref:hypothetical protein n=1 Tax=Streptomyces syringium TaxID=76729 RepID=UPI003D938E63